MIVTGIDVSKRTLDASRSDGSARTFANTPKGHGELLAWAGASVFCLEPTASYHEALADFLHASGYRVAVANPARSRGFARVRGQRGKTDRADAACLCEMGLRLDLPAYVPLSPAIRELRDLTRARERLAGRIAESRTLLKDPGLRGFAREQEEEALAFLLAQETALQERTRTHVREEDELREAVARLRAVPGFGPVVAAGLLAETGGAARFESPKALAAFLGVCPSEWTSGTSVRGRARMSKAGSPRARSLLYMAALAAVRDGAAFQECYQGHLARGMAKKAALGAVMHKLARVAWALLAKGQAYDPQKSKAERP